MHQWLMIAGQWLRRVNGVTPAPIRPSDLPAVLATATPAASESPQSGAAPGVAAGGRAGALLDMLVPLLLGLLLVGGLLLAALVLLAVLRRARATGPALVGRPDALAGGGGLPSKPISAAWVADTHTAPRDEEPLGHREAGEDGMVVASTEPVPTDDPLDNRAWLGLVEGCVQLYDDLDRQRAALGEPATRDFADYACFRLQETLERAGVEVTLDPAPFDQRWHRPEPPLATVPRDARVAQVLSPGFSVGRRVLRKARVRLADGATPG